MQTTLTLNLNNLKERQALRAMLDVLDDAPPEGLDIQSGPCGQFDPARVTMWTSKDGEAYLKDNPPEMNPNVDQVVTKTVEKPEKAPAEKPKKEPKAEKKTSHVQAPTDEDARAIVEAVVGVKVGRGTEVEGPVSEVVETLDGEKIDDDTLKALKGLQVKLAKYGALDELKETIRDITGIKKGKLQDIPAKHGEALIDALNQIVTRLEEAGK